MVNLITLQPFRSHFTPLTVLLCSPGKQTSSNTGPSCCQLLVYRIIKTTGCQSSETVPGMFFWVNPFILKMRNGMKSVSQPLLPTLPQAEAHLQPPDAETATSPEFKPKMSYCQAFTSYPFELFLITTSSHITFVINFFPIMLLSPQSLCHFIS